jgi:hypothetical protein
MDFDVRPPATGLFGLTETRDLGRGRCLAALLKAREQPVDLAAHCRFFAGVPSCNTRESAFRA